MHRPGNHKDIASVRRQAAEGGLRFEAYLPPGLAEWVISLVEQGVFHSPSEAVFGFMATFGDVGRGLGYVVHVSRGDRHGQP
jgi:hypothetical protein